MAIPSAASAQPWRDPLPCASRMGSRSVAMWDRLPEFVGCPTIDLMSEEKIVIVDGARTPVGSFGGVFKDVPAHELGATAARAALARAQVDGADIAEVVMGCIGQVGPDAYNARRVAIAAGLPKNVPAYTVNRLCGSGLQAIWSAAMEMRWNGLDLALAGGDESMTRMPFYDFGARNGYRLGDRTLVDGTVMMLTDPFHDIHMGVTAENVAAKYAVSRERAGRVRGRVAASGGDRRGAGRLRRGDRRRSRSAAASRSRRRRTSTPSPSTTLETLASLRPGLQQGRHGHGRQRLGHQRRWLPRSCWRASRRPPSAG